MYLTLDNQEFEITKMTKAFLVNALTRYEALCSATNITIEIRNELKITRDEIKAELKARHRLRFNIIKD